MDQWCKTYSSTAQRFPEQHRIDINQAGAVAGLDYYPALWEADDTAHILSSIDHGYAYDVNKFLFVTGNVGPRAFVWTPTGGLELLDHHPAAPIGSTDTAIAINDAGHAVGFSEILPNENDLAFFWTADGKMMDLNALLDSSGEGWILQVAWDINNHDQIVGFGTYNGEQHLPAHPHANPRAGINGLRPRAALFYLAALIETQTISLSFRQ